MKNLIDVLKSLHNEALIELSKELQSTDVPQDALIRNVIKDTEVDTDVPVFAFVAVGQLLSFVLAERLNSYIKNV